MTLYVLEELLLLGCASTAGIQNKRIVIDMVQNNPGDAVAWQHTKYFDGLNLLALNYTGQTTTGEMSGTQAVDFHTVSGGGEHDYFPADSAERAWLDAYNIGVHAWVSRLQVHDYDLPRPLPYFFVDLLVFPKSVLAVWTNATDPKTGQVLWNEAGKQLTRALVAETIAEFPTVAGWIVRTGETYVFDLPFHTGNTPVPRGLPSETNLEMWADFVNLLREELCVKAQKQLIMRSWDSFPSNASWYLNLTARIDPHSLLYFSVKHTPADFVRPSRWNPTLGIGAHAQIVEIELQREYEGKQAFPNYIVDGVIDGFPEVSGFEFNTLEVLLPVPPVTLHTNPAHNH